ncbi:MAG: UDP-N-acetylglucosamine 1-carboxyvinyltransferase [Deferribacteres bacterium]|nr:UDP-N-acetylglucosamine 1-carboxyvinyltransferase [Deferribacteres bacterium]
MEALVIEGGVRLKGEVEISGAKNAVLPIMAAALLTHEECVIRNVPDLRDVRTMIRLLESMGVEVVWKDRELRIKAHSIKEPLAPYELVKTMRASVLVLGPLVAREGVAKVSLPGGCAIGERPIDLHIKGLKALGADVDIEEGYVIAEAPGLKGALYIFDKVTVTGTENILMAAVMAEGETILENVAQEPEVWDLITVLRKMGAEIEKVEPNSLRIVGVDGLCGFEHEVMPDRIEAATFLITGALCSEYLVLKNARAEHMVAVIAKLRECGVEMEVSRSAISVKGADVIDAADVETQPYPGFPTDVQAQYMAMMSLARGTSVITENIFEKRFTHAAELRRMGANILVDGNQAVVRGVEKLKGAPVMASDLRASASLVIAALAAEGKSRISRIYHLDRGYEAFDKKLEALGARIRRVKE